MTQADTKKLFELLESLEHSVKLIKNEFLRVRHENQMKKVDKVLSEFELRKLAEFNNSVPLKSLESIKLKDLPRKEPFLTGNPLRKYLKTDRVKPFEKGINFCECLDDNGESCFILENTKVFLPRI